MKLCVEHMTRLLSMISFVWLFGCAYSLLFPNAFADQDVLETKVKAAGCFIPTPKGIVLGIHRVFGDIRIPFGSRNPGETARQTAVRETLEETGLHVTVGPLLQTFENDTALLFHCTPTTPIEDYSRLRPLDALEVSKVIVIDPTTMLNHDGRKIRNAWRIPEDRALFVKLFEEYKNKELK